MANRPHHGQGKLAIEDLIVDDAGTRIRDLEDAPAERLREVMLGLDMTLGAIKGNLQAAKVRFATEGVRADPEWMRRTHAAQKLKGLARVKVQAMLAYALQRQRAAERSQHTDDHRAGRSFHSCFTRVAKERLPGDLFEELTALARERLDRLNGAAEPEPRLEGVEAPAVT